MTTNTAQVAPPVRQDPRQVSNTLKLTFNALDAGYLSGVAFANSLPRGAFITSVIVEIVTAFDGGGQLTVGTVAAGYNNIVAAGDVNEAAIGITGLIMRAAGRGLTAAADITPYVLLGAAATVGQAVITIIYEGGFDS